MRALRLSHTGLATLAGLVVLLVLLSFGPGCGEEGDFPGEWVSVRGEHVVITARADGDYDVKFVDPGADRSMDMTFTLERTGKKLEVDLDGYFVYVTLGGDQITIERIGNIQTYSRVE